MPTQAKLPFPGNVLITYIRQRLHPALVAGLGVFVLFFSRSFREADAGYIFAFLYIVLFLFVFRLYDDLLQSSSDTGKPDRDYTDPGVRKKLFYYLFPMFIALLGFTLYDSYNRAFLLLGFVAVNHFLYLLFVKDKRSQSFLPLLKYPFVFILLQPVFPVSGPGEFIVLPALALFAAFIAFETMEDAAFPIPRKYSYFLQVLSFSLILFAKIGLAATMYSFFILLSFSLVSNFFRLRPAPYMYMLFFLVFRVISVES